MSARQSKTRAVRSRAKQRRLPGAKACGNAGGGGNDYPPLTEEQVRAIRAHHPARKPGGVIDSLIG